MTSKTCSESGRTTMLMGSSPRSRDLESLPEHVVAINPDGVQSGGDRRPFDRRNDCGQIADHRFGFDPPDEAAADIAFVDEGIADAETAGRDQMREPRRRAGAARAGIDRPGTRKRRSDERRGWNDGVRS